MKDGEPMQGILASVAWEDNAYFFPPLRNATARHKEHRGRCQRNDKMA